MLKRTPADADPPICVNCYALGLIAAVEDPDSSRDEQDEDEKVDLEAFFATFSSAAALNYFVISSTPSSSSLNDVKWPLTSSAHSKCTRSGRLDLDLTPIDSRIDHRPTSTSKNKNIVQRIVEKLAKCFVW